MNKGSIRVSRDFFDDKAFRDEEFTQREAFLWLIMEASFKPRTRRVGSVVVETQRGQVAVSTRFCAKAWQWTEPRVRRYFNMLKKRRMIQTETDAGVTVITLCKYDEYQSELAEADAGATQDATQERRTTDANENKGNKDNTPLTPQSGDLLGDKSPPKQKEKRSSTRRPYPPDWKPSDKTITILEGEGYQRDFILTEAAGYRDWCIASGVKWVDHEMAFKNKIRKKPPPAARRSMDDLAPVGAFWT